MAEVTGRAVLKGDLPPLHHATPAWTNQRGTYKTVAFRTPDWCNNESYGKASGQGPGTGVLLYSACSTYVAELERAMAQGGYKVVSWDALRTKEGISDAAAYEKAKQLGVDIVFVIHSMELTKRILGTITELNYNYFEKYEELGLQPDETKSKTGYSKVKLGLYEREYIKRFVRQVLSTSLSTPETGTDLMSVLDIAAISPSSGQIVWFYNKTFTGVPDADKELKHNFIFQRTDLGLTPYVKDVPNLHSSSSKPDNKAYSDTESLGTLTAIADPDRAAALDLIRKAATDFVTEFAGKR